MIALPPAPALDPRTTAIILAVLSGLFIGRVIGQVLVVHGRAIWLPPMNQWYSGLLPYRQLLAIQIVICAGMAMVITGLLVEAPMIVGPYPAVGTALILVAYLYALAMAIRYVLRMTRYPDQRWLGGCIPIVFHVVLAMWILVLAALWRGG